MKRFFNTIDSLDQYTRSLQSLPKPLTCPHCQSQNQFISHGFIYKQHSITQRTPVGKRIFCSNRYTHSGCGSTVQLYLNHCIPHKHYHADFIERFIAALLINVSVTLAYQLSTGKDNSRQAWRWLRRFSQQLLPWRAKVSSLTEHPPSSFTTTSHSRQCLLETWLALKFNTLASPILLFQSQRQQGFF